MPPRNWREWAFRKMSSKLSIRKSRISWSLLRNSLKMRPSLSRPSFTPTSWSGATDGYRAQNARSVPDDGGGHARQMAREGGRRGEVGRHPRGDRNRQGDDGVRGGGRGDDRQNPGPGRQ